MNALVVAMVYRSCLLLQYIWLVHSFFVIFIETYLMATLLKSTADQAKYSIVNIDLVQQIEFVGATTGTPTIVFSFGHASTVVWKYAGFDAKPFLDDRQRIESLLIK